jgi:hypothetical protein
MVVSNSTVWVPISYGAQSPAVGYAAGDVIRIEHHAGGNIVWKLNGTVVRTSASPYNAASTIFADLDCHGGATSQSVTFREFRLI